VILDAGSLPRGVLLVGLTGGIASGKSTVAGMFRELGAQVVDADALVHELMEPEGEATPKIREAFGPGVIGPDGGVDRDALAKLVFEDEALRRELEAIVHPLVVETSQRRLSEAASLEGVELVIYDAALLFETGRHRDFERIIVVTLEPELQLARLMERDALDSASAGARIRSQLPLREKVEGAHHVIDNSGPWTETRRQVREVYETLIELARARGTSNKPKTP
jgi:dephospho-CoA kinase